MRFEGTLRNMGTREQRGVRGRNQKYLVCVFEEGALGLECLLRARHRVGPDQMVDFLREQGSGSGEPVATWESSLRGLGWVVGWRVEPGEKES